MSNVLQRRFLSKVRGRLAPSPLLQWLERYRSRRRWTGLTREGWHFLVIIGFITTGALLRDINLMLLMAAVMVGLLMFNYRAVRSALRGIRVERESPRAISAGAPLLIELALANSGRLAAKRGIVIEDRLQRESFRGREGAAAARVFFPCVVPGVRETLAYRGVVARRGRYRLGPLRATCRYPLGLVERTVTLGNRDELVVFPRPGRLTPAWQRLRQRSVSGGRCAGRPSNFCEGDFYALRAWRPGDSHRWIHWRTSARRDELVVRQFEEQQCLDLILVVDLWQPRRPSAQDEDRVELAASFAATVVTDLCRHGIGHLLFAVVGRENDMFEGTTSTAVERTALKLLAIAEADEQSALDDIVKKCVASAPRGTPLVIISTRYHKRAPADVRREFAGQPGFGPTTVVDFTTDQWQAYFDPAVG